MTIMRLSAGAALAIVLGLVAIGAAPPADAAGHPAHDHAQHGTAVAATASLSLDPERPRAGQRAALAFTITDGAGAPLEELVASHERKLHTIIISEDMAIFGHVHPEDFGEAATGGKAKVFFAFPQGGRYLVGIDFATKAGPHAAEFTIDVDGQPSAGGAPDDLGQPNGLELVRLAADDSYTGAIRLGEPDDAPFSVALQAPEAIRAGEAVTFLYRFADGGAAIDDLRPYLGAAMHVAAVKDDLTRFMHGHGESVGTEMASHGGHGGHRKPAGAAIGPEVAVTLTFPAPGRYFLFGQAARGDRMLVSRVAVQVR